MNSPLRWSAAPGGSSPVWPNFVPSHMPDSADARKLLEGGPGRVATPPRSICSVDQDTHVGSRTGAVFRRSGLACCSPFPLGVPQ